MALAVYEAGGRAIHLPLEQEHPLVAVLRAALGVGARGDLKVSLPLLLPFSLLINSCWSGSFMC